MKTIKLGKHTVELYDAIEDLPVTRYHRFNKFMLIDAGLGSDLTEIDAHISKAIQYFGMKENEAGVTELQNMRQAIYFVQNELTPKHLAFAALIKSVDGNVRDDISEAGLKATLARIEDATVKEINSEADEIKKKLDSEILTFTPDLFDSAKTKEYYSKLKQRTILFCDALIEGRDPSKDEALAKIDKEFLVINKPLKFWGEENEEIKRDRDFEYACLTISQHLNADAKAFTTLEYYNALNYIQDISKREERKKGLRK